MWQDPLGVQGQCVKDCCSHGSPGGLLSPYTCHQFSHSWQVWAGPLAGSAWVVVVVNRFDKEESISMDWALDAAIPVGRYTLIDLWTGQELWEVVVGGEVVHFALVSAPDCTLQVWEHAQWKGILPAHDNWAFRLNPVEF